MPRCCTARVSATTRVKVRNLYQLGNSVLAISDYVRGEKDWRRPPPPAAPAKPNPADAFELEGK